MNNNNDDMNRDDTNNNNTTTTTKLSADEIERSIERFCEYLRYETVSATAPDNGEYTKCATWIKNQLNDLPVFENGDVFFLEESPSNAPVVVAHWKGIDETLPILLLNSHYDVVPAPIEAWTVPPFGGLRTDDKKIYGRGTQDMKCVGVQYIEAIRKLNLSKPNWRPRRSIYLTYVPDEEIGGAGMACFLESKLYKSLPGISLALDEGLASTTESFDMFYGERLPWFVSVTAHGPTGHGSRFIENTAVEQLIELCNKALAFRQGQRELLLGADNHANHNCAHAVAAAKEQKQAEATINGGESASTPTTTAAKNLGDVTSLNITSIEAGVKAGGSYTYNCVPPKAQCSLDIRIAPNRDPAEIANMLDLWCRECSLGDGDKSKDNKPMEWEYLGHGHDAKKHALTSCDPKQNKWFDVFQSSLADMGYKDINPRVFPAATDSRFLRALGIRAFGFSPMRSTSETPCEILLHENDEYIPEATFIEGIHVYVGLIHALGSQGKEVD